MLNVTGRQQPLHDPRLKTAASANGGDGKSFMLAHRSEPLESAKQCLAAKAACLEVNVTTAYVESREKSSKTSRELILDFKLEMKLKHRLRNGRNVAFKVGIVHLPLLIIRSLMTSFESPFVVS